MASEAGEGCQDQLCFRKRDIRKFIHIARMPADCGSRVTCTVSSSEENAQGERVDEAEPAKFACSGYRLKDVSPLYGSLELTVKRALRGHERMFA